MANYFVYLAPKSEKYTISKKSKYFEKLKE